MEVLSYAQKPDGYYTEISFKVTGVPMPSQSFKYTQAGRKYLPGKVDEFRKMILAGIQQNFRFQHETLFAPDAFLKLRAVFAFHIPKNTPKSKIHSLDGVYRKGKPDLTNLLKNIEDGMSLSHSRDKYKKLLPWNVYLDDGQIVAYEDICKIYGFEDYFTITLGVV